MSPVTRRSGEKRNRSRGAIKDSSHLFSYRVLIVVLLLMLSAGLYLFQNGSIGVETVISEQHLAQVKKVAVYGDIEHIKVEQIEQLVRETAEDGMLALDLINLRDLLQKLPWVYRVKVRKVWPETIEVWLREQSATVMWGDAGYLNLNGEFFVDDGVSLDHLRLPAISSQLRDTEEVYHQFLQLSSLLDESGQKIQEMVIDQRGSIYIHLESGLELNLGRRAVEQRLARWSSQYPVIMSRLNGGVRMVDLRYEQGMAIQSGSRASIKQKGEKL